MQGHTLPQNRALNKDGFQRAYKACLPCARRKVKCQLGEGEDCVRCNNKRIKCTFTAKKPWSRIKGTQASESAKSPLRRQIYPPESPMSSYNKPSRVASDHTPKSMLQQPISNDKDALNVLFEAIEHEQALQETEQPIGTSTASSQACMKTSALDIWNAYRFVKMGWLSASEAMSLVEFFFANMSPLSPILTDFFATPENHFYLVTQEPLLCCTILMISSRYHTLKGAGGPSRTFCLHHRLWEHCEHLLLRLALGQEKRSKARTRNEGSIEALLLLSEWHSRSLQSPPRTDGWDSDFIMLHPDDRDPPSTDEDNQLFSRWKDDIIEPTKCLERMAWMVLNLALAIAHELGVFDSSTRPLSSHYPLHHSAERYLENIQLRRQRLPSLLFVFINSLALRTGYTSPIPLGTAISMPTVASFPYEQEGKNWISLMSSWVQIIQMSSSIMKTLQPLVSLQRPSSKLECFMSVIEEKQLLLSNWWQENALFMNTKFSDMMLIEYQYLRVLVNSVGMQLVIQRVIADGPSQTAMVDDQSFIERTKKLNMTSREHGFIEEVIDGSCTILEKISFFSSTNALRFVPVRILYRAISCSVFLFKALVLGVRNPKLQETLRILDKAITSLQNDIPDDIHLQSQYAALLKIQATKLRTTLLKSNLPTFQLSANAPPDSLMPSSDGQLSLPGGDLTTGPDLECLNSFDINDWLSLPSDLSMTQFGSHSGSGDFDFDEFNLNLDFR